MSDGQASQGQQPGHQTAGLSPHTLRVRAMEALLVEKGVLTHEEVQQEMELMASRTPSAWGRVVAKAWVDPAFKARLLADPKAALAEVGYNWFGPNDPWVLENTEKVHHMVVCSLCSCYPRELAGLPPYWYKDLPYRSRAVVEPRAVLHEFGLDLPEEVELRVVDTTAELRYLILPRRPPGTEHMGEEELARLVTGESLIGTGLPLDQIPVAS